MDETWKKVTALDLNSVRRKFALKKGWWWGICRDASRVEREYRQFLFLVARNPGKTVVPWSRDLDDFWHQHILDTSNYARDCGTLFGSLLHHSPQLPNGPATHGKAFAATREMYKAAFGQAARKGRLRTVHDIGCGSEMPVVFRDGAASAGHHGSHGHHDAGGHPGHHGGHGGGHHSCGSHGGGHSSCGGHGGGHGCGGHGCGGHGCGSGH